MSKHRNKMTTATATTPATTAAVPMPPLSSSSSFLRRHDAHHIHKVASLLYLELEIRNRKKPKTKTLLPSCFIGGEAVSWLSNKGHASSRAEATRMGDEMIALGLIVSVDPPGLTQMMDAYVLYEFTWDIEDAAYREIGLPPPSPSAAASSSFPQEGHAWAFPAHTAHNSMVLDMALAKELENVFASGPEQEPTTDARPGASQADDVIPLSRRRACALLKLRERVRQAAKRSAPGWHLASGGGGPGQLVAAFSSSLSLEALTTTSKRRHPHTYIPPAKHYRRSKPLGEFRTTKTVGIIPTSPQAFLWAIYDLDRQGLRQEWEPLFNGGVVVEALPTMDVVDCQNMYLQVPPAAMAVTPLSQAKAHSSSLLRNGRSNLKSMSSSIKQSFMSSFGLPPRADDGERGEQEQQQQQFVSSPSMSCSSFFSAPLGAPSDAVADKEEEEEEENKDHEEEKDASSAAASLSIVNTTTGAGAAAAAAMPVARFDDPALQAVLAHLSVVQSDEAACVVCVGRAAAAAVPGAAELPSSCPCCGIVTCTACRSHKVYELGKQEVLCVCSHCFHHSHRIVHPDHPDGKAAIQALNNRQCPQTGTEGDKGGGGYASPTSTITPPKWARCASCHQSVPRTLEAIEAHESECTMMAMGRRKELSAMSPCPSPSSPPPATTRIIYRTALSPAPSLVKPREVCVFQDSFADDDGTIYIYEITTRHRDIEGSPGHTLAEVPFLCYALRPLHMQAKRVGAGGEMCVLTVISQLDVHSKLPRWVGKLVCANDKEHTFGLVATHERGGAWKVQQRHQEQQQLSPEERKTAAKAAAHHQHQQKRESTTTVETEACSTSISRCSSSSYSSSFLYEHNNDNNSKPKTTTTTEVGEEEGQGEAKVGEKKTTTPGPPVVAVKGTKVGLSDFDVLTVIGRGGFGKVYLCRRRGTDKQSEPTASGSVYYAMKVLHKDDLRKRNQIERARTERQVLAAIKHPFIVGLHFSFHTSARVYMVMDFMQGGDLFALMRRQGRMSDAAARIYTAEIALALVFLHERGILYRDLKPENILVGWDGHLKLTDFGLCRHFEISPPLHRFLFPPAGAAEAAGAAGAPGADYSQSPPPLSTTTTASSSSCMGFLYRTHSFCGTNDYLSPEILLNQGHGAQTDWWCLGVCLHEMLTRKHPFKSPIYVETLRNICAMEPLLGKDLSGPARSLILRLLDKNPDRRLGGLTALQTHPFFLALDWEALLRKEVAAPYRPQLHSPEDTSCFSKYYTDERMKYSEVVMVEEEAGAEEGRRPGQGDEEDNCCLFLLPPFLKGKGKRRSSGTFSCHAWWTQGGEGEEGEENEMGEESREGEEEDVATTKREWLSLEKEEEEAIYRDFDFVSDEISAFASK